NQDISKDYAHPRSGTIKRKAGIVFQELAPLLMTALFVIPFLILLSTSFKPDHLVFSIPPTIWSEEWTIDNYKRVFEVMPFWRYFLNTTFLAMMAVIGTLLSCPLVAYSLAKVQWREREWLFLLIIST